MNRPLRSRSPVLVLGALGGLLALAACGNTPSSNPASPSAGSASGVVLDVGTSESGPMPRNLNPLVPTSALASYGAQTLIYEPLLQQDTQHPSTIYPWLAKSYAWSNDDRTLTFHLRRHVSWSDGKPFTSADVAFTFEMLKRYPALNTNGITFSAIRTPSPNELVMTFAQPNYAQFPYIAATPIVPRHVWDKVKKPPNYADPNPVGTGPFILKSYQPSTMLLTRNPHYWGPKPKIDGLRYHSYDSNTGESAALSGGQLDWATFFSPKLKTLFLDKSRANHVWFPLLGADALFPNLKVWPTDLLAVRKAISLAINRQEIYKVGGERLRRARRHAHRTYPAPLLLVARTSVPGSSVQA